MVPNLTFYGGEEEECKHSIVEATSGLGDTGQDGERVQKVTVRGEKCSSHKYDPVIANQNRS